VWAVIDTNVWTSAVINPAGRPARVFEAYKAGWFELVTSDPLTEELADVLSRPKVARKHGRHPGRAKELAETIQEGAVVVEVSGEVALCRDPDDDAVIETALKGGAHVLVTRDDDLKADSEVVRALEQAGVRVLTVTHFLAALEERFPPQVTAEMPEPE
jgi:uncharacterized protein